MVGVSLTFRIVHFQYRPTHFSTLTPKFVNLTFLMFFFPVNKGPYDPHCENSREATAITYGQSPVGLMHWRFCPMFDVP